MTAVNAQGFILFLGINGVYNDYKQKKGKQITGVKCLLLAKALLV